jgi:tRNA A-37 threonylcarbamoyl transferase component Bud32
VMSEDGALSGVAEETGRRRRRPSGEPRPLVRGIGWQRRAWGLLATVLLGVVLAVAEATDAATGLDRAVADAAADLRTPTLVDVAKTVDVLTAVPLIMVLRWGTVLALAALGRFRHLVVFLTTFVVTDWVVARALHVALERPDVPVLADAGTYAFPSRSIAALAITLVGVSLVLVPRGAARRTASWLVHATLLVVVFSELILATDYVIPMGFSWLLATVLAGAAFRTFVPEDVFPVTLKRGGNAAHLDLGGERGEAIVRAMRDQLGVTVMNVEPFGLEGSGGSSPLRMTLDDGSRVFAKVYSTSHARADRWYRVIREVLYGQLEDETPMGSVRRLVTYEDYALRSLRDAGVDVARTYGVVELTPNREYMLVTEFFEGGRSLSDSDVDDTVIDGGLDLVRHLWDAGFAHRDLKPANLLVVGGHLQLVDVSALEVRPSPWRQAVDLANMMLCLALRSDADRVYARATSVFTPDEIAEGFASAVGLAIPTELSEKLKADGRPLIDRFKELAPAREPVSIQRWSPRRAALTAAVGAGVLVLAGMLVDSVRAGLT